ncbi:hypothetical protein ACFC0S_16710 [Streptomyces sp. NPDC056084]|uniref:hypothetical protein n=1 Tax=unclassified Streptomyces TaxID=2593676 RepID=UPI0035E2D83D
MATTDNYGQGISIPALTDAPNIEGAVSSTINALVRQTIMQFASATARSAAITSPLEGMQTWLQDVNAMQYYDGTQWLTYEAPQVQAYNGSVTLTSSASAYTALNLGAVTSSNNASMWSSGQPTRLVAPTPGTYAVMGAIVWPGLLGSADGRAEVRLNGSATGSNTARFSIARGSNGNAAASASGTVIFTAAGQYLEVYANQNSGGSLNVAIGVGMNRISNAIA